MNIMRMLLPFALLAATACSTAFALPPDPPNTASAVFAGGCFWCIEADFEKLDGVLTVVSGYAGGPEKNPSYKQVSAGSTGHTEVVRVVYDPKKVTYLKLVDFFFRHIDPTTKNSSFCDFDTQYRTAIFYGSAAEKSIADQAKKDIDASKQLPAPVVTEITQAGEFWPAEDYHQDYYKKSPGSYASYRAGCRRDARVQELWGQSAR